MANYTAEDIQMALEQGLISPEDAAYMQGALEPGLPVGGMAAGALGAAGGGYVGSQMTGGMAGKLQSMGPAADGAKPNMFQGMAQGAGNFMDTPLMGSMSRGQAGLGALGLGALGAAGYAAGDAMFPGDPGMGIEGQAMENPETGAMEADRDYMLRLLIDPNVSPKVKKQIMAQLEAAGGMPGAQAQGGGEGGFPWGQALGTGLGAGAGMVAGGLLGGRFADSGVEAAIGGGLGGLAGALAGGMGGDYVDGGSEGDLASMLMAGGGAGVGGGMGNLAGALATTGTGNTKRLAGTGLGALGGALGGAALGSMFDYSDPLEGEEY